MWHFLEFGDKIKILLTPLVCWKLMFRGRAKSVTNISNMSPRKIVITCFLVCKRKSWNPNSFYCQRYFEWRYFHFKLGIHFFIRKIISRNYLHPTTVKLHLKEQPGTINFQKSKFQNRKILKSRQRSMIPLIRIKLKMRSDHRRLTYEKLL